MKDDCATAPDGWESKARYNNNNYVNNKIERMEISIATDEKLLDYTTNPFAFFFSLSLHFYCVSA